MFHSPEKSTGVLFHLSDDILQYLYLENGVYSQIKNKNSDETLKYF